MRLKPRYSKYELEILLACIKPVECWTAQEHKAWLQAKVGFRHFIEPNVTPIERYQPMPLPTYSDPRQKPAA